MTSPVARAHDVLGWPLTYDIVVGDFGREPAIEYLRLVAAKEKRLIRSILDIDDLPFFDEYRRIMFASVHDIAFLKSGLIAEQTRRHGRLTEQVLLGEGLTEPPAEFLSRMTDLVDREVASALHRGYERVRVILPCNGLSPVAEATVDAINVRLNVEKHQAPKIQAQTVPASTVEYIARHAANRNRRMPLLILGTRGAQATYARHAHASGLTMVQLGDAEQDFVNEAILIAIDGRSDSSAKGKALLTREVVEPVRQRFGDVTIVEACTDFSFNLGVSSLEVFAIEMVRTAYPLLSFGAGESS